MEDCELKEFGMNGESAASVELAVPGRVLADIGGGGSSGSCDIPALMLSNDNLEKMAINASIRGKITVSLNLRSVIRRTSNSSPRMGIFLFAFGSATSLSEGSAAPQKSAASRAVMTGPRPLNSRSKGKNTACMKGKIVLNTSIHIETRCGTSLSSGMVRKV